MQNKILKFKADLVPLILSGEKTTTWRLFDDKNLQKGDRLIFVNHDTGGEFAKAKITDTIEKTFRELVAEDHLRHETYDSEEQMYQTYVGYYGRPVGPETVVKIVKFSLL